MLKASGSESGVEAKGKISTPVPLCDMVVVWARVAREEVGSGWFGDVFCGPAHGLYVGCAGKRRTQDDSPG